MYRNGDPRIVSERLLIALVAAIAAAACTDRAAKPSPAAAASTPAPGPRPGATLLRPQLPPGQQPPVDRAVQETDAAFEKLPRDDAWDQRTELRIRMHLSDGEVTCRKFECRI